MANATFKGCMSPEITYINKMPSGSQLKLDTKFSYNVKYSKELTCQGEMTVTVNAKNDPENFAIKVRMIGAFTYKEGADKDLLHVETFQTLFPFVRALVSTITTNAGIPPIILPNVNMEGQSIYRIESN